MLDFAEERQPDDFGDPGRLLDARLDRVVWVSQGRPEAIGYRRCSLLLNGLPVHVDAKHRRYLRWRWIEPDPAPHDDSEWVLPP